MIQNSPKIRKLITGLDELFAILPPDYSCHDTEFESIQWQNGEDIVIKFSDKFGDKIYYITWRITPCNEVFDFCGAPHNPYVSLIDVKDVVGRPDVVRFECEGSGLVVNATAIHVNIQEIPQKDYKLFNL